MFDNNEETILGTQENGLGLFVADEPETSVVPDAAPADDGAIPSEPIPESNSGWLSEYNKAFNTNFGSVDELKSNSGTITPPEQNEALQAEFDALKVKQEKLIEHLKQSNNPLEYFADEKQLKANLLVKSNPNLNKGVAGEVFDINLETANPLDIIATEMMLTSKVFKSKEDAKSLFLKQEGIDSDLDFSEYDAVQRMAVDLRAEQAAAKIAQIRDSVQLPTSRSMEDILAEVSVPTEAPYEMTEWNGKIPTIVESVKEVVFKDDAGNILYQEAVDAEFREGLDEVIEETIKARKLKPTPENIEALRLQALDVYKLENLDKIAKRLIAKTEARLSDEYHKKYHNDVDPDKGFQAPPSSTGRTSNLLKILGIPEY